MAASGSTTIQLYNSSTASAVPTSGNLVQGELGINVTDKKIYTKNASAAVVVVGFGPDASVALTALTGLTVSSGGASITGNTSVAGTLAGTTNTEVGLSLAVTSGTDAKLLQWVNGGGTYTVGVDRTTGGYFGSAYSFGINVPTGRSILNLVNSSLVTEVSSTGLTVTGNSSATGTIYSSTRAVVGDTGVNNALLQAINTGGTAYFGLDSSAGGLGGQYSLNIWHSGNYPIVFAQNNTERARFDTSGNFGLGVTPSNWAVAAKAIEFVHGSGLCIATGGDLNVTSNAYNSAAGVWSYRTSGLGSSRYQSDFGTHRWYTAPSGTAGNPISFTQAMTLDTSGNLLVGTTSNAPSAKMVVYGGNGVTVSDGTFTGYIGKGSWVTNASASDFGVRSDTNLLFMSGGGTERGRFDTSGNLLVGTTSQPAGVGSSRLGVVSSASDYTIAANNSNASPYGFYLRYTGAAPNGNSNPFFYFQDTGGARAYMQSNGGLANYSANDSNLSDIRTKKDFVPAKSYYERWTDIEFVTFLYKDQTDTERNLGVTAQQLESVFPELIDNSGFGETPEDGIPLKAVYQTDFQYATARALQEAIEQIEILKAKVAALEARA